MPTYRVKDNPQSRYEGDPTAPAGFEFEWDGVTVDGDGDIRVYNCRRDGLGTSGWVLPEHVELVEPNVINPESVQLVGSAAAKVVRGKRTVEVDVITVELTTEEATFLHDQLAEIDDFPDLYVALNEVLNA